MSTANLDPTTDGTRGTFTTLASGTTNLGLAIDDYTGGGAHNSDTDGVMGPNNGDSQLFVLLSDTPTGFDPATISQVQIKSAYRLESAGVSGTADTCALFYQLFRSDETTAITTELSKGNITSTSYAEATDALTVTGSHTKTDWDGARLRIRQDYTIQGCADTTTRLRVTAAQIILTYSYAATAALTTGGLSASATATETFGATAAATTGGLSVDASVTNTASGNTSDAALTVAGLNAAASAAESFDATAAATTAGLSVEAALTTLYTTAALTTAGLGVTAAASEAFPATAGLTTAGLSVDVAAAEAFPATADLTLGGLSVAASANRTSTGADVTVTVAGLSVSASVAEAFEATAAATLAGLSVDAVAEFASNDRDCTAELVTAGLSCFAAMTGPSDVHLPEPEPPRTIQAPLDDWIKSQQASVGGLTGALHPSLWRKRGLSG